MFFKTPNVMTGLSLITKILEESDQFDYVETRNGGAWRFQTPLMFQFTKPRQRVLISKERNANPFFHAVEILWMLSGSNRLEPLQFFIKNFGDYSDNGITLNGAYGERWRYNFFHDQLAWAEKHLRENPSSRRCVIGMFDPDMDHVDSKDIPCNTHLKFDITKDKRDTSFLNLYLSNRSNDIVWGMLGANYVHFTALQEYMANRLGIQMGTFTVVSFDAHVYQSTRNPKLVGTVDWYKQNAWTMIPIDLHDSDLEACYECFKTDFSLNKLVGSNGFKSRWMRGVFKPMMLAYMNYQEKQYDLALKWAGEIAATDWSQACEDWINIRLEKKNGTK